MVDGWHNPGSYVACVVLEPSVKHVRAVKTKVTDRCILMPEF